MLQRFSSNHGYVHTALTMMNRGTMSVSDDDMVIIDSTLKVCCFLVRYHRVLIQRYDAVPVSNNVVVAVVVVVVVPGVDDDDDDVDDHDDDAFDDDDDDDDDDDNDGLQYCECGIFFSFFPGLAAFPGSDEGVIRRQIPLHVGSCRL